MCLINYGYSWLCTICNERDFEVIGTIEPPYQQVRGVEMNGIKLWVPDCECECYILFWDVYNIDLNFMWALRTVPSYQRSVLYYRTHGHCYNKFLRASRGWTEQRRDRQLDDWGHIVSRPELIDENRQPTYHPGDWITPRDQFPPMPVSKRDVQDRFELNPNYPGSSTSVPSTIRAGNPRVERLEIVDDNAPEPDTDTEHYEERAEEEHEGEAEHGFSDADSMYADAFESDVSDLGDVDIDFDNLTLDDEED